MSKNISQTNIDSFVFEKVNKVWKDSIIEFEKIYNPEQHASPFLFFVDMIMNKCDEKDESEKKLFQYLDCVNFLLKKEEKQDGIVAILIEDGADLI